MAFIKTLAAIACQTQFGWVELANQSAASPQSPFFVTDLSMLLFSVPLLALLLLKPPGAVRVPVAGAGCGEATRGAG